MLDYSIIIPVFNKAALTQHCLRTLPPTLEGCGEGEVIVIDNASSDETPQMLAEFPWVRVVRNETNLGFAGANNQGARLARGRFLILLNNDTEARPGWLARMLAAAQDPSVGVVGARLLYPNGTLQHAGVTSYANRFGSVGFVPVHDMHQYPANFPYANQAHDLQLVTGACLLTPRDLYLELGGLDEAYWNGYEDMDYCLQVRRRGLRVVYEGRAELVHYESQSGTQRFRKVAWNCDLLARRWNGSADCDGDRELLRRGYSRREVRLARGNYYCESVPHPAVTIVLHGPAERANQEEFTRSLRANRVPIDGVMYAGEGAEAIAQARRQMRKRGNRYVAFVDTRCTLRDGWLDELALEVEFAWNCGAAAYAPEAAGGVLYSADARCTLVSLRKYPAHHRLAGADSLNASLCDFLERGLDLAIATRPAVAPLADLPAPDAPLVEKLTAGIDEIEQRLRRAPRRQRGLVSIVMLSWNAVDFTKMALDSIRRHTSGPYEVIIVDNGSKPETVEWLRTQQDVHVIYNETNRGYAGGNNQAIAAARGEYVVLLNNDVIVTEGWLDGLLAAFDRIPGLGVSAPRSNKIAGDQLVSDAQYTGAEGLHEFARVRSERYRGQGYLTDRAIGLCLCIDRRVIEEVGGLDERFGLGNFEDDDYSIRVRAAGYKMYVCDDVFIHHFGSQSFAANKVDYAATMRTNWAKFSKKWGFPAAYPENGYDIRPAIARGFDPDVHYFALPAPPARAGADNAAVHDAVGDDAALYSNDRQLVIAAVVRSERDWNNVGAFIRRYVSAFSVQDRTLLTIAAAGELDATTLGRRIERALEKLKLSPESIPDLFVSDEDSLDRWTSALGAGRVYRLDASGDDPFDRLPELAQRSPSALRRLVAQEGAA